MLNKHFIRFMIVAGFILMPAILSAQEFNIAVGRDSTFGGGAVFGGSAGIVAIIGDTLSQYNITAQLVSPPTNLIGNRISIGRTGVFLGAQVAFDGTNYLMVWAENNGDVNGQFISQSGNLVGTYFTIGTNASLDNPGLFGLLFSDTTYLVGYVKVDTCLYGQRVNRSGNLIGGQIQISNNHVRSISGAYDGTNYLVAWVDDVSGQDHDFYGQFVNKTGTLVGGNFLIDGSSNTTENGLSLAFGGTRYLLVYPDENPNSGAKNLLGRFISTTGTIEGTIVICDTTKSPNMPSVAFDNTNYLITWAQFTNFSLMGRFYNPLGVPLDTPFVLFDSLNGRLPIGGCGFGGGWFLVVGSRINFNFTDGDVYGRFIHQTGIEEENAQKPGDVIRLQNHPNPFNSFTTVPGFEEVNFELYDASGRMAGTYKGNRIGADLTPGVYFARRLNSSSAPLRIVKVR